MTFREGFAMATRFAALIGLLLFTGGALAQKAPIYSSSAGAIQGFDPVAYFTEGRPVRGTRQFTHQWNGATWRFSSAENRDRFAAAPQTYAPQYGGYCAYGVANGYAVRIDPQAWSVVDGKLYLNYSKSVQASWLADVPGYIRKAEAEWPQVLER
jgi:YHS domain-containing protein